MIQPILTDGYRLENDLIQHYNECTADLGLHRFCDCGLLQRSPPCPDYRRDISYIWSLEKLVTPGIVRWLFRTSLTSFFLGLFVGFYHTTLEIFAYVFRHFSPSSIFVDLEFCLYFLFYSCEQTHGFFGDFSFAIPDYTPVSWTSALRNKSFS
jgi:hypothetical protein